MNRRDTEKTTNELPKFNAGNFVKCNECLLN
jgi:hypothetical protein